MTDLGELVKRESDHYCTNCYEVVPFGETQAHREEEHDGRFEIDIVPIHIESEGLLAQERGMGHFGPHQWIEVDDHQMCAECGAVQIERRDVSDELVADRTDDESSAQMNTGTEHSEGQR